MTDFSLRWDGFWRTVFAKCDMQAAACSGGDVLQAAI
jgi:hypothetical protein